MRARLASSSSCAATCCEGHTAENEWLAGKQRGSAAGQCNVAIVQLLSVVLALTDIVVTCTYRKMLQILYWQVTKQHENL